MEETGSQGAIAPASGNVMDGGSVGIGGDIGNSGGSNIPAINDVLVSAPFSSPDGQQPAPSTEGQAPWYSDVKEEYHEFLSKWGSSEEFIHGAFNQSKMLGKKVSDFANEDWTAYNNAMRTANGIPTDASGYTMPSALQDGRTINTNLLPPEMGGMLQELCHQYELTPTQAEELMSSAIGAHMDAIEESETVRFQIAEQGYDYIDSAWSGSEPVKGAQIYTACTEVLPAMIGKENTIVLMDALAQHGLHMNPAVMNLFTQIGGSINTGRSNGYSNICPEDAAQCLETFRNDVENQQILSRPHHPKFKQKSAELQTLIRRSNGEF